MKTLTFQNFRLEQAEAEVVVGDSFVAGPGELLWTDGETRFRYKDIVQDCWKFSCYDLVSDFKWPADTGAGIHQSCLHFLNKEDVLLYLTRRSNE